MCNSVIASVVVCCRLFSNCSSAPSKYVELCVQSSPLSHATGTEYICGVVGGFLSLSPLVCLPALAKLTAFTKHAWQNDILDYWRSRHLSKIPCFGILLSSERVRKTQ